MTANVTTHFIQTTIGADRSRFNRLDLARNRDYFLAWLWGFLKIAAMLSPLETNLLILMTFVIMFGLGCTLSIKDFKDTAKNPKPALIGFFSQYLFMPIIAFSLAKLFEFSDPVAIGLIIVACCPSGATSSLFNYFAKGDLALSISLSSITTAVAIIAMPVLLSIYTAPFTGEEIEASAAAAIAAQEAEAAQSAEELSTAMAETVLTITAEAESATIRLDYGKLIGSLLICLIPVAAGMFLKSRSERWAKNMEETGGALGIGVILFLIASWLPRNAEAMLDPSQTNPFILVASIGLGLGGFLFGYIFSRILKMKKRQCRTVALETGIQNGPLAFAIILLTFNGDVKNQILWPALLYSFFIVNTSTLVTYLMRKYTRKEWFNYENEVVKEELFTQGWLKP